MKKKIIGLLLCILVVASLACSVSASGMSGNGYTSSTIYYNGKPYAVTMTTQYDPAKGGRTMLSCIAAIHVQLHEVRVEYDTITYGYVVNTGGAKSAQFDKKTTSICSGYVKCSRGMDNVENYRTIQGTATITSSHDIYTTSVLGWYVKNP